MTVGKISVVKEYVKRNDPVIPSLPMIAITTPAVANAEMFKLL